VPVKRGPQRGLPPDPRCAHDSEPIDRVAQGGVMVQQEMTPEQFGAKVAELKAQGINLTGGSGGRVSNSGVTVDWKYDGKLLQLTVVKKPFIVSNDYCESKLRGWLSTVALVLLMLGAAGLPARAQAVAHGSNQPLPHGPSQVEIQACSDQYNDASDAANKAYWQARGRERDRISDLADDFAEISRLLLPTHENRDQVFAIFCGAADRAAVAATVAAFPKEPTPEQVWLKFLENLDKTFHAELQKGENAPGGP
jgi:hypothetical protein